MQRKISPCDTDEDEDDDDDDEGDGDVTNGGKLIMLKSRAEGNYLLF